MGVRGSVASQLIKPGFAAVIAVGVAAPAAAQEAPTILGWTLDSLRAGVNYAPDYMGSDDYRPWFTGAVVLVRRDAPPTPSGAPDDGVSLGLFDAGPLTFGVVGRWRSERKDEDDLRGFEKIDPAVEAGGFVNWWASDWLRMRAEVRRGFGGHEAWVGDLAADAVMRGERWTLTAGPRLDWGDEDFTSTYFAVTPLEASRSPLGIAAYSPSGASWSPGVVASAKYRVTPRWSVESVATYYKITGDAADSPIVGQLGSDDQFSISLSGRYTLGQ